MQIDSKGDRTHGVHLDKAEAWRAKEDLHTWSRETTKLAEVGLMTHLAIIHWL
jgi:hypothetical protein